MYICKYNLLSSCRDTKEEQRSGGISLDGEWVSSSEYEYHQALAHVDLKGTRVTQQRGIRKQELARFSMTILVQCLGASFLVACKT